MIMRDRSSSRIACGLFVRDRRHYRTHHCAAQDNSWQVCGSDRRKPNCSGTLRDQRGKVVWILYVIVGFFAALAGMARASYMSLGDPLSGD